MEEKIAEAADEVGAGARVGRGAEVGSSQGEAGMEGEAARYLPHLRGKEVSLAGEAGAELGRTAGMAERGGSKRIAGVR